MMANLRSLIGPLARSLLQQRPGSLAWQVDRQRHLIALLSRRIATLNRMLRQRDSQIAEMKGFGHPGVKEARFRQMIGIALAQYFVKHDRSPELCIPFDAVKMANQIDLDRMPDFIPHYLERPELSEPEFAVFQHFKDADATVIDIGAHFGYSAASIWRAGCPSHILSIEPNPWNLPALQRIKELRPGRYDYIGMGVGKERRLLRFVVPVVDGMGIGGLASASLESEVDWELPENLVHYMMNYRPDEMTPRVQFAETQWEVAPLDELLATRNLEIPTERISAIKMDVEGLEEEAVAGATQTLQVHKPMLMVEQANRAPAVAGRLQQLGYQYADFNDGTVFLSNERSVRASGFYLHGTRLDEYRSTGLLVPAPL